WNERACLRDGHSMSITSVAFSPDGEMLASCSRDHRIVLWDLAQARAVRSWKAHDEVVHDVVFTPDGRGLVSVGKDDGSVKLWDLASGSVKAQCECPSYLLSVALSPDGKLAAAGGYGSCISLWNPADQRAGRVDLPTPFCV